MAEDNSSSSPAQQSQGTPARDENTPSSSPQASNNHDDTSPDVAEEQADGNKDDSPNPLDQVVTFETVEDFWAVYNHIELASKLGASCDYCVFKRGIKPMWEDPNNAKGGRWLIQLDKKHRLQHLDSAWLEILLCLIGESFDEDGHIVNGAVVNIRTRGDKIGVWLGNAKLEASIMHVGKVLKKRLGLGSEIRLGFEAHEDTMQKSGSTAKSKYLL